MNRAGVFRVARLAGLAAVALAFVISSPVLHAQEAAAPAAGGLVLSFFGAALGLGMIVIGAGAGHRQARGRCC